MIWCTESSRSIRVAPHAGAWIEIKLSIVSSNPCSVAPHAGAWIEISLMFGISTNPFVAPHAGAWIEIQPWFYGDPWTKGRSPCGSVD